MTSKRMLLVEDDRPLADLVAFHFERVGYSVTRTADGEEALILVEETRPDVILLDWMIEGISGIEVCRRLRRRSATSNVPIIMLTARGDESDRIRGLDTGADDYVTKPFSPRELVARVGAVLRRIRPALNAERLGYADVEMDVAAHRVRRFRHRSAPWPDRVPPAETFPRASRAGLFPGAPARDGVGSWSGHRRAHGGRACAPTSPVA
jgi:two-component system, OmpR family, phosphate regulon response regulator PhoB